MARILFLTTYPEQDASSRRRVFAVASVLRARGHVVKVDVLIGARVYQHKNDLGLLSRVQNCVALSLSLIRRIGLAFVTTADVVVIHREAFPFFTPQLERLLRRRMAVLLVDVDDGIHVSPGHNADWRRFLRNPQRFLEVTALADVVLVASPALVDEYAAHARLVELAPTSPDPAHGAAENELMARERIIAWVGSQSTLPNLLSIWALLLDFIEAEDARLYVLGGANVMTLASHPRVTALRWTAEEQVALLARAKVGIMPLTSQEWDRYKGAYKLMLYLMAGVPAVVSPTGLNAQFAQELPRVVRPASTGPDWASGLRYFLNSSDGSLAESLQAAKKYVASFANPERAADIVDRTVAAWDVSRGSSE